MCISNSVSGCYIATVHVHYISGQCPCCPVALSQTSKLGQMVKVTSHHSSYRGFKPRRQQIHTNTHTLSFIQLKNTRSITQGHTHTLVLIFVGNVSSTKQREILQQNNNNHNMHPSGCYIQLTFVCVTGFKMYNFKGKF